MLNKSFVAIAMLSFVFTATAFGQKEIVVWSKAKNAHPTADKRKEAATQTKSFTGSDEELGALVAWSHANKKNGRKPKAGRLIDTSTGEIVWADEVRRTPAHMTNANRTKNSQMRPKGIGGGAAGGTLVGGAVARTKNPRRAL